MDNTNSISGLGLVFFQEDGSVGGFIRTDGGQLQLAGKIVGEAVILTGASGVSLRYSRVAQPSDRHPVGKGVLSIGGEELPVAIFSNRLKDGRRVHGVSLSGSAAKVVDAPF